MTAEDTQPGQGTFQTDKSIFVATPKEPVMSLASRCMDAGATLVNPFGYFFELPLRALAAVAFGGREVVVRGQKNGRPDVQQLVSRPAGRDFFWTRPPADMGIWLLIVCATRKRLQRLLKNKELSFSRMCISLIRKGHI